jgi:hypothetical protein
LYPYLLEVSRYCRVHALYFPAPFHLREYDPNGVLWNLLPPGVR